MPAPASSYLHTLLSQTLVAFTVEFDNEFERRMIQAGHPGATLSLSIWTKVMRFLAVGGQSVRDLTAQSRTPEERVKLFLGCLERWHFIALRPDVADDRPVRKQLHTRSGNVQRDGWGSGRGIRSNWMVALTEKGAKAAEIWPPLFPEIERRWQDRFGAELIAQLRQSIEELLDAAGTRPLPALLARLLRAFATEFDAESKPPLSLCANIIRVLGEEPVALSELPRLTGCSRETSDPGWQTKPYVAVEGKYVRLTPLGLAAQKNYHRLAAEIEERWKQRHGAEKIQHLRDTLTSLFLRTTATGHPLLSEGLIPADGTVRDGEQVPALGRRDVGVAARRRARDLVAQTELFIQDPAKNLPHYPAWDMNRGFGP